MSPLRGLVNTVHVMMLQSCHPFGVPVAWITVAGVSCFGMTPPQALPKKGGSAPLRGYMKDLSRPLIQEERSPGIIAMLAHEWKLNVAINRSFNMDNHGKDINFKW
jgi:hypothetical protein